MKHTGRIGLVRHGQTFANVNNVWHGHTDTELTKIGHQQTKDLGRFFKHYMQPDVIYTSPLQRARITAEAIGEQFELSVNQDARLMELHLGDWEGESFESLKVSRNVLEQLVTDPDFTAPNGESQNQVKKRVVAAIEEIVHKHPDQNVVIVAHGVTLGIALSHYIKGDTTFWPDYSKNNTAFSELCLNSNSLLRFNVTEHLNDEETE